MKRELWTLAAAGMVAVCGAAGAQPAARPAVDGVYALEGRRLLRIGEDKLEILYDSPKLGRQRTAGAALATADEVLLTHFNGEKEVESRVTFGVVGGHLWVGVLRRRGDDLWVGTVKGGGVFAAGKAPMPDAEIAWDLKARRWSYAGRGTAGTVVEPTRAVPVGRGAASERGERFVAVVDAGPGVDALKGVLQREPAFNPDTNVYAGNTIIAPVIVLQAAQPAGSHPATVLSAEMLQKAVDTYTGWRRMTYERVGDVMLTPWSVDLGPVGLMPAKANANQALGHWESAGRGLDVLAVAERPQARANPPADVQLGRPRAKEIDAMESRLEFDADDGGIHTKTYGWFCGANHGDHEGYIYWFLAPDDRLVRILYPAYCDGGGGPRPQNPRVDVYVKK